jgi:arsenate reductase (thioredoxin)
MDAVTASSAVATRVLDRDVAQGMATVLRALADPLRVQVVSALATAPDGRMAAGDIAGITALTAPTVSHHLKSLRDAGVVVSQRQGTWVYYALAPGMDRVASGLLDALSAASSRAGQYNDAVDSAKPGTPPREPALVDADAVLAHAAERLVRRFPGLDGDLVTRTVRESYTALGRTARVTQHLPVLAERFATQRLQDIERATSADAVKPQVLFVCVANAGRSQLAATLLRKHAGDAVVVRSAGSMPAADVHATVRPLVDELLAELGDQDAPFPKPLTDDAVRAADVVITMGCGDTCPILPGKRYEDWAVGDPALASPAGVRAIFQEIESRVRDLAGDLTRTPSPNAKEQP